MGWTRLTQSMKKTVWNLPCTWCPRWMFPAWKIWHCCSSDILLKAEIVMVQPWLPGRSAWVSILDLSKMAFRVAKGTYKNVFVNKDGEGIEKEKDLPSPLSSAAQTCAVFAPTHTRQLSCVHCQFHCVFPSCHNHLALFHLIPFNSQLKFLYLD